MAQSSGMARKGWLPVAIIWIALILLGGHVYVDLDRSRAEALDRGVRLSTSYVRLVGEHALSTFDRTDLVLEQAVKLPAAPEMARISALPEARRKEIETGLKALQAKAQAIVSMTMTDRDGTVLANTVGTPPGGSLGDRRYFLALKNGSPGPVVSEVIKGRVSNIWGVQMARPILGPSGQFLGMVVANIGMTNYMEGFYGSLSLAPGSIVSLRDLNHRMLVRHPVLEEQFGKVVPTEEASALFAAGAEEGHFTRLSPFDGMTRIHAVKKLPRYGIYALVAIPEREVLGAWQTSRQQALVILALSLLFAIIATVMAHLKARSDKALATQLSFLDVLLDTLPIPIFARDRDGVFTTCNRAYERFFGRRRSDVVGRTVHQMFPKDLADSYAEADHLVMAGAGSKTYEIDVVCADGSRRKVLIDKACYGDPEGEVAGIVATVVDITDREAMERELRRLATTDPLTGVGNRRHFLGLAEAEMCRVHRHDRKLSVITFDIDHFKQINDTYGHGVGDDVIRAVADCCVATLRQIDVIGRMGGEEFAIMLPETDVKAAFEVASRLHVKIGAIILGTPKGDLRFSASFGVTQVREQDLDIDQALRRADAALYEAKETGRDRVIVHD